MHLKGEYCYYLNSADKLDGDLPLTKTKAWGGTMALWKLCYNPFVTIHPPPSTSILPLLFNPPQCSLSIHVAIYLPTSGKESQFIAEVANLSTLMYELATLYPETPICLRGDFNVNPSNQTRNGVLQYFIQCFDLKELHVPHNTYHHFTGDGVSDS